MKKMILSLFLSAGLLAGAQLAHAEETMGEKAKATGNTVKRSAKKGMNRVEEAVCMKGDAKCLAQKAGNRMEEGADYVKDKAVETKDAVDSK